MIEETLTADNVAELEEKVKAYYAHYPPEGYNTKDSDLAFNGAEYSVVMTRYRSCD